MAREFFCAYHSMLRPLERLADEQCGRLFRALLAYSMDGVWDDEGLDESAAMLYEVFTQNIDRDRETYRKKCEKNRENINKRWEKDTNVYERYQEKDKYKNKEKDKYKEEEKEKEKGAAELARMCAFLEELKNTPATPA